MISILNISGGFAMLPFLWFVNSVWFFKEAFFKPPYEQQKQIKTCKIQELIGCFFSYIWYKKLYNIK
jgi:presenilin enhancer 2